MRYQVDHDLHIHSMLSRCSGCPEQNNERILQYGLEEGFNTLCLTNHFWDERVPGASPWYEKQGFDHICQAQPLPQAEGIQFLFGCETELDKHLTLGISRERIEKMDLIIIPTTHFHMKLVMDPEDRASVQKRTAHWLQRLEAVLAMDLPFHKVGLAHLTCHLIGTSREDHLQVIQSLPRDRLTTLFEKAARLGVGIELNAEDIKYARGFEDALLEPYRIAKRCGCKFYCGSDAHEPAELEAARACFEQAVTLLELTEDNKFRL